MAKISDIIHGWLGWCPNAGQVKVQGRYGSADAGHNAYTLVQGQSSDGADPAAGPWDQRYEHTQAGWVLIGAVGSAVLLLLATLIFLGPNPVQLIVLGIMLFVLAITSQLTVSVGDDRIRIRYGPVGLIRKEWLLSDIVSAMPVTSPWYYGYGIRVTPHGMLYNVSGRHAVEVLLLSGKKVRIGTDEPGALCRAIRRACAATGNAVQGIIS